MGERNFFADWLVRPNVQAEAISARRPRGARHVWPRPQLVVGCGLSLVLHGIAGAALIPRPPRRPSAPLEATWVTVGLIDAGDEAPATAASPAPAEIAATPVRPARRPCRPPQLAASSVPAPAPSIAAASAVTAVADAADPGAGAKPPLLSPGQAQGLRVYDEFPALPEPMRLPGAHHEVGATICVSDHGVVTTVAIDNAGLPLLERALASAVHTWRYRPWQDRRGPHPFCHRIVFEYRMG